MLTRAIESFRLKFIMLWNKGAFHILIGNFMTKFVAFFGSIFLVRILSKESYGVLAYVENIYGYVYILAGMGLANSILRFVVLAKEKNKEVAYYKYALNQGSLFNVIIIIVVSIIGYYYPHTSQFMDARWLLIAVVLALPFQYIMDVNIFTLRAKFDNKKYALAAFVSSTVLVTGKYIGAFLWDINGVILAKILVSFFLGIILLVTINEIYYKNANSVKIDYSEKKIINSYSIQYMITNGIWTIFMLNDIFLLGLLNGDPSVIAEYKVAYVLPGNLAIISGAIGIFVAPYFVRKENDYLWIRKNYLKVLGVTTLSIGIVVLILIVFSKQIITLLYGVNYINIVPIMRLLLVSAFINSGFRYTTANLLAAMGQIKYNMIVSIIGVIAQVITNIYMIPKYGVFGVAITSILIYTIMTILLFVVFAKKYYVFGKKG